MSGLWKLPELWTRKRTRAHKLLGRRQTDAGAHSYHSPRVQDQPDRNRRAILSTTCLGPCPVVPGGPGRSPAQVSHRSGRAR